MKIHKNIRYVALSLGLLMATSCDDVLDVTPKDELVADVALTSLSDFRLAMNGVYSGMTSASYYGTSMEVDLAYLGDNVRRSIDNRGQGAELHNFTFAASNGESAGLWTAIYRVIDRTNIIINRIDAIEGDQATKDQIKGEALAARALAYHDLVRLFAKRYDATPDASHLGVPIMLESKISEPARNTVKEVYDRINQDLVDAKTLITDNSAAPQRLNDHAVAALQARVALYQKQYQKAIDFATEAINAKGLANRTNFAAMWNQGAGTAESYFTLAMTANNARVGELFYELSSGTAFMNPSQSLIATFGANDAATTTDERNADIRFDSYISYIPGRAAGEYIVTKYSDANASIKGLNNIHVIRAGEMYLTRAEAYAALGGFNQQALEDLNAVRTARIEGYEEQTLGDLTAPLKDVIIEERRKELAFEGHRIFDLKRLNTAIERGTDCSATPTSNCTIPAGNFRFTLPIPQDELFANPNIVQNEGYLQ